MDSKAISGIILALLFIGMLTLTFNIRPVKAAGTIYIRAEGSVDPQTAPISSVDNVTYTFTDDIFDEIVVERDNIVVDGAGYTLQGTGSGGSRGVDLSGRSNVTIKNMAIKAFHYGIELYYSLYNTVSGNNVTSNGYGIELYYSSYNIVSGNNVTSNGYGIEICHSSCNKVYENNVTNNNIGVLLCCSARNSIYGNNLKANSYSGIWIRASNSNSIYGNTITDNMDGVLLSWSSNNAISGNTITDNYRGTVMNCSSNSNSIYRNNITNNHIGTSCLLRSSNNKLYHNNFINNRIQADASHGTDSTWDDGYPSGGNYWSDYTGVDEYSELYQNITGSDGIGDIPYVIDENNHDQYPLMNPYVPLLGDLNGDGIVDIKDIVIASIAFGSYPGHAEWNPAADVDDDGKVDIKDIVIIALHFGETI